jgi:thioredoxin-like negative regulator of GroEL
MVSRLSKKALQHILAGKVKEPASIAIKFYSNNCQYCHALKEDYESMAEEYKDVLFFAFNVQDYTGVEDILEFKGVPTICMMKVGTLKPRIRVMPEPPNPNKETWYARPDIKSFIEKEK